MLLLTCTYIKKILRRISFAFQWSLWNIVHSSSSCADVKFHVKLQQEALQDLIETMKGDNTWGKLHRRGNTAVQRNNLGTTRALLEIIADYKTGSRQWIRLLSISLCLLCITPYTYEKYIEIALLGCVCKVQSALALLSIIQSEIFISIFFFLFVFTIESEMFVTNESIIKLRESWSSLSR